MRAVIRAQPIARANYALALFETGDDLSAIEATRGLLRKDPEFWCASPLCVIACRHLLLAPSYPREVRAPTLQ